jgi:HEAT repeat protein
VIRRNEAPTTTLQDLIARYLRRGPDAAAAMNGLIASGPAAVTAVLERAEDTLVPAAPALMSVIAATADSSTVDRMLDLMTDPRPELSHTALLALGYLGDRRATPAILERFISPVTGPDVCVPAATALAHLRDPATGPPLRALVSRWTAEGHAQAIERFLNQRPRSAWNLMWPLMATVALAAIGDQEFSSLAFDIVSLPKQRLAALPDGGSYLDSYYSQLRHLAGPGLVPACRAALDGADRDARSILADVLAGIGTREAFALMVDIAADPDREVSRTAAGLLEQAAGAAFSGSASGHYGELARAWWQEAAPRFEDGTVYWSGRPWTPDALFDSLLDEADAPDDDLRIVTGLHLGQEMRRRGASRRAAIAACRLEAKRTFTTGKLYRYGYRFDAERS